MPPDAQMTMKHIVENVLPAMPTAGKVIPEAAASSHDANAPRDFVAMSVEDSGYTPIAGGPPQDPVAAAVFNPSVSPIA